MLQSSSNDINQILFIHAPGANGEHTVGKFECLGRVTLTTKPTNCYDLFIAGNQISAFYTIKGIATQLKTVYCDFSKAQGATGNLSFLVGFFICSLARQGV